MRLFAAALLVTAAATASAAEPRFRADGPEAVAYGQRQGYPICSGVAYIGDVGCRVGAFSRYDELFPARFVKAPARAAPLKRAAAEPAIAYDFEGRRRSLDDYLNAHHVTGLLIARGDTIMAERYQYGRHDKHRLASFSMAKTVVALLVGLAVRDRHIASIDDLAERYAKGLAGTEYGRTPIRALLQMASGVAFSEVYTDPESDASHLAWHGLGLRPGGVLAGVARVGKRIAPPGERMAYSSGETSALALALTGALGRPLADYMAEKLWQPLGAEADASWIIDPSGQEIGFAFFNATLRDWARLGLMLAHDGAWNGQQVLPRDWVLAATRIGPDSPLWSSGMTSGRHYPGYGYQTWLLPAQQRRFALRGLRGQFVIVDPEAKLVLVQTALRDGSEPELLALFAALAAAKD